MSTIFANRRNTRRQFNRFGNDRMKTPLGFKIFGGFVLTFIICVFALVITFFVNPQFVQGVFGGYNYSVDYNVGGYHYHKEISYGSDDQ